MPYIVRMTVGLGPDVSEQDALDALFADKPETLSVSAVADLLNMSTNGVYRWIREGVIPAYKVGSTWFVLRDELHKEMRSGRNDSVSPPGDSSG